METDSEIKRNKKTLRDQFGHYPIWMNSRQIKKHKNKFKVKRIQSKRKWFTFNIISIHLSIYWNLHLFNDYYYWIKLFFVWNTLKLELNLN
jgi:hypothetical protein